MTSVWDVRILLRQDYVRLNPVARNLTMKREIAALTLLLAAMAMIESTMVAFPH